MFTRLSCLYLLVVTLFHGSVLPANIDKAKIDADDNVVSGPHHQFTPMLNIVVADSGSEYSMWTQQQECLAYNPTDEYLQFVCRNFVVGNNLDVWQNDKTFSSAWADENVYTAQMGGARYPHSIASVDGQGPHISAPVLISGAWGGMMGQYESGGWFSSLWDNPVDLSGNVGTHKNDGHQLPNGNILFIGVTGSYDILYRTYNTNLSQQLASGVVAPATSYFWGFDVNGGIGYVFWYDANLNVYYKTTTDGINWSAAQTYNLIWPQPFTNNLFYWCQMAVTDVGNPILVFDIIDGSDNEYPYVGKIYVSTASGQPCTEVSVTTAGAENFYPTIATGGNYVVALFGKVRSGTGQYTFWDVYYNYSLDNGLTWHTPIHLTNNITDHNNCLWQIAKRLDPGGNGQFFFVFGSAITDPMLDLYWDINNGGVHYARWYVGRNDVIGIAEGKTKLNSYKSNLLIMPNPANKSTLIKFSLAKDGYVRIDMYDAMGRIIKNLTGNNYKSGCHTLEFNLESEKGISDGVYFIRMKTDDYQAVEKLIIRE